MSELTVSIPSVGTVAVVSFKEPYASYVKGILSTSAGKHSLEVISVTSMDDVIRISKRDVFMDVYNPVGLSVTEYGQDLLDKIPLISFSNKDEEGFERLIRVPLNYVEQIRPTTLINYATRFIILDLGKLPVDLDLTPFYGDLKDYVASRVGVESELKDTTIDEFMDVSYEDFTTLETIRVNSIKVNKTLSVRLEELELKHSAVMERLRELGIELGEE